MGILEPFDATNCRKHLKDFSASQTKLSRRRVRRQSAEKPRRCPTAVYQRPLQSISRNRCYRPASPTMETCEEKKLMRAWLVEQVESKSIDGLQWVDDSKDRIRIPWLHGSRHGYERDTHSELFRRWAQHTGKYDHTNPDPKRWKANFRCGLNSLPDVEEEKEESKKRGENAYKVYRLLPATRRPTVTVRTKNERHQDSPPASSSARSKSSASDVIGAGKPGGFLTMGCRQKAINSVKYNIERLTSVAEPKFGTNLVTSRTPCVPVREVTYSDQGSPQQPHSPEQSLELKREDEFVDDHIYAKQSCYVLPSALECSPLNAMTWAVCSNTPSPLTIECNAAAEQPVPSPGSDVSTDSYTEREYVSVAETILTTPPFSILTSLTTMSPVDLQPSKIEATPEHCACDSLPGVPMTVGTVPDFNLLAQRGSKELLQDQKETEYLHVGSTTYLGLLNS